MQQIQFPELVFRRAQHERMQHHLRGAVFSASAHHMHADLHMRLAFLLRLCLLISNVVVADSSLLLPFRLYPQLIHILCGAALYTAGCETKEVFLCFFVKRRLATVVIALNQLVHSML